MLESKPRHGAWYTAALALILFAANASVIPSLFHLEYSRDMGSIEAAFISLVRYIRDHFPDLHWFPLWYGGIPFQDSYPPLLHLTVAAVSAAFGISPALAYHAVAASVYALGPVTLFWMAWRLCGSRVWAFLAALLYSAISPSCWLIREVRADAGGWFGPRRGVVLMHYGEGPHFTSMLLLPLAIGLLHLALRKRTPLWFMLAGLSLAGVALSNWLGAFALAVAVAAYLLSGFEPAWRPAWIRAALIGSCAYAIAMPWIPPSTIAVIRANAPLVGGKFESTITQRLLVVGFCGILLLLAWLMARLRVPPPARFGLLFFYATAAIVLTRYWFHQSLLPQPERYHLEMDMAFWLAAAFTAQALAHRMRPHWRKWTVCLAVAVSIPILVHQHRFLHRYEQPIDIHSTVEYQTAQWLNTHMPGSRVFAPGTIGFWLNAFSDNPQLTGGFDNGERNHLLQSVIFQIYAGDQQNIALDYLRAFGCDAVIAGGSDSAEVYHPYAHPEKFHGLTEQWRRGGDAVYAVPRHSSSLAHALRRSSLVVETPPGYSSKELQPYLAALEDPSLPPAAFRWHGTNAASITANLRPDDLLSVQVTWDAGWNARVAGASRPVWGDKLGQMVIEPRCDGPCTVELTYDGGREMWIASWLSRLTLAAGLAWLLLAYGRWRKHSDSTKTS
ncbi:MAG TPA: hypothetical protein VG675_19630 [Bryobacteraceae bacterium]|nr:hypothetical protein [Bryobacteraceae bacterium]